MAQTKQDVSNLNADFSFKDGILISSQAVLKIFFIATAGAILERNGFLNSKLRSGIAKLVYIGLLPCLLFTSIAPSMNWEAVRTVYILPIIGIISPVSGLLLGSIIGRLVPNTPSFGWRQVACCTGLGNGGYIPLIFVPAVMVMNPFNIQPHADESMSGLFNRLGQTGLGYVGNYLLGHVPTVWFFGPRLMKPPAHSSKPQDELPSNHPQNSNTSKTAENANNDTTGKLCQSSSDVDGQSSYDLRTLSTQGTAEQDFQNEEEEEEKMRERSLLLEENPSRLPEFLKKASFRFKKSSALMFGSIPVLWMTALGRKVKSFVGSHVPELTCWFSVVFGLTPGLQGLFFSIHGHSPALFESTITAAIRQIGNAVSPLVILILGANLVASNSASSHEHNVAIPKGAIAGCFIGKLILHPLLGFFVAYLANLAGFLKKDPILAFVIILEFCMPTAPNLIVISELANTGKKEISTALLFIYIGAIFSVTIWSTLIIFFIKSVVM